MTVIERAVSVGAGLIVFDWASKALERSLRLAAGIAGRPQDVTVLTLSPYDLSPEDPCLRRLLPADVPTPHQVAALRAMGEDGTLASDVLDGRTPLHVGATGPEDELGEFLAHPAFDLLPGYDLRSGPEPGAMVVVRNGHVNERANAVAHWLSYRAARLARVSGREGPLVILPDRFGSCLARLPGYGVERAVPIRGAGKCSVVGPRDVLDSVTRTDPAQDQEWGRRVAVRGWRMPKPGPDGIARFEADDRFMACRMVDGGAAAAFLNVDAAGWADGVLVEFSEGCAGYAGYEELAEHFWHGGCPGWDTYAVRRIAHRTVGHDHLSLMLMDRCCSDGQGTDRFAPLIASAAERVDPLPFEHPWMTRNVHRFVVFDDALRSRRLDFVRTWPVLSGLLVDPVVRAAVDAGVPAAPVVASWLGMTIPAVRRLVGRYAWPFGYLSDLGEPRERHQLLPAILGAFDVGHLPAAGDPVEWSAFIACLAKADTILRSRRMLRLPPDVLRDMLVRVPARDWAGRLRVLDRLDEARLRDVNDFAMAFRALCLGMGIVMADGDSVRALAGGRSLVRMYEASQRWHRDPGVSRMAGLHLGAGWRVPFEPVDLGDGWSARCLSSNQELVDEGSPGLDAAGVMGLDHCVATYAPACLEGRSLIMSLRSGGGGVRETTVELVRDPRGDWRIGGRPYAVVQNRAHGNEPAGAEAKARLATLRAMVTNGRVPIRDGFDERRTIDPVIDEAEAIELLGRWQPYLPSGLSGLSPHEFKAILRG